MPSYPLPTLAPSHIVPVRYAAVSPDFEEGGPAAGQPLIVPVSKPVSMSMLTYVLALESQR